MTFYDAWNNGRENARRRAAQDREIAQEEEVRQYQRNYAGALSADDYSRAEREAARYGDVEGVTGARSARSEADERQREQSYQRALPYLNALEQIDYMPEEQRDQAWNDVLTRAMTDAERDGGDAGWIRQVQQQFPRYNPRLAGTIRMQLRNSLLTAQQQAQYEQNSATLSFRERQQTETERHNQAQEAIAARRAARVGGGGGGGGSSNGPLLAGAEQRGRIVLSFPNIVQSQRDMASIEQQAAREGGSDPSRNTPFGRDWGARLLESVPFDGGSTARIAGGSDYTGYEAAIRTFEQSVMPIFSGSAVTESEAQRFVRANLPRFGDSPEVLRAKAQNRARIINSAAVIIGAEPPFPEAGTWSPSGGLHEAQGGGGGRVVTVNSPEEAANLPAGTRYRTPDGDEYVR